MTLTSSIVLFSVLDAFVVYGLVHLLAYGIHRDHRDRQQHRAEVRAMSRPSSERIAA